MPSIVSLDVIYKSGGGLIFGHMYTNGVISVTLTDQNTWYEIDGTTAWTTGLLHNCTFTDPEITVGFEGMFEVIWDLGASQGGTPTATQEIEFGIMVNGSIQSEGQNQRTFNAVNDTGSTGGNAIIDLAADDDVSLGLRNISSAGKTIDIEHGNMTVLQIGGT